MDKHRENELLTHVAAGIDLPTAFAALPRESDAHDNRPVRAQAKTFSKLIWATLTFLAMIACWWLIS
jgi:hypothetical protein